MNLSKFVATNPNILRGIDDPLNSTTIPLLADQIWTGEWVDVLNYSSIALTIFSDVSSATDGLMFQWSENGVDIDVQDTTNVVGGTGRAINFIIRSHYFRLRYRNGATPQTVFRVAIDWHTASSAVMSKPLGKTLTNDDFSQITRAVVTAENADSPGNYEKVQQRAGKLLVDSSGSTQPISGTVAVSNFPATQPVSAAALPLPSGASTEATLLAIKAKTDNIDVALSSRTKPADTQKVDGSAVTQPVSGSVSVSNFPASQVVTGPLTNAELRALAVPISGSVSVLGTVPVSGTFFQATQPISAASLPLPTGAATEATLGNLKTDLDKFTFTATRLLVDGSGVVQPISGTITAQSIPASSPTQSSVSVATTATVILASNVNRLGATIYNESGIACYLKLGTTASLTSYSVQIAIGGYYEVPFNYTGGISGITVVGTSVLRITELAA